MSDAGFSMLGFMGTIQMISLLLAAGVTCAREEWDKIYSFVACDKIETLNIHYHAHLLMVCLNK